MARKWHERTDYIEID